MSVYGIDLGTTYSCLSKFEDGKAEVIQNVAEQSSSLPSAVYFESESSIVVGNEAKNMVQTDAANVVQFVKREIGKNAPPHSFFGQDFSAIDISAMILKKIKAYAEDQGEILNDVVITCPAYFGFEERDATKKAGELAGFNVLALINEPTAASISYAFRSNGGTEFPEETVLIYDLGGGTFDVTILHITSEEKDGKQLPHFEVLATDGDDQLGGKDWDVNLRALLMEKVCSEAGVSEDELDEDDLSAIQAKVEPTKKALSAKETSTFRAPIQGSTIKFEVTRQEFEDATSGLVTQTIDCVNRILTNEKVAGRKIDKILLVGGSSNMPMIPNAVKAAFPDTPVQLEEPELAVAKGAACYAYLLTSGLGDANPLPGDNGEPVAPGEAPQMPSGGQGLTDFVDDLCPRSFGIGMVRMNKETNQREWRINNLVFKDTIIGEATHVVADKFRVPNDGVEEINVPVYENISSQEFIGACTDVNGEPIEDANPADQVKELGRFVLAIPPESRVKGRQMIVDFRVDTAGVHVTVKDGVTGTEFPGCDIVYNSGDFNQEESEERINAFEIVD